MIRHHLTLCFFALSLLSACTTTPIQNRPYFEKAAQAESLMSSGQHKQAAELYQNLAEADLPQQNQFRLLAAEALIQAGDSKNAKKYADRIDSSALSPEHRSKLNLVYAQISLSNGNAEQALDKLNLITIPHLGAEAQRSYFRAAAFAYSLTGDLLASAKARIKLSSLLFIQNDLNENNTSILETLSLLPQQTLMLNQPPAPNILGGWMALTSLLKQKSRNIADLNARISDWKHSFPDHPANTEFLTRYLSRPRHAFKIPAAIAIMLPESGPYAQAAKVIREGLMAAYYHQQDSSDQPVLRFYDSEQGNPVAIYDQAVSNGAELIIGPLNKKNIEILASIDTLNIPVLSLNHVENLTKPNLYQFGLSPIDDAQQITAKAWLDGHQKALILTSETGQGKRIANYLTESWLQTDGKILGEQSYNPKEYDFSNAIKKLLTLDESEQRYQQLRRLLARNIEFTPRRRQDVDAIFINAYPQTARSLNPQLRFYHATNVPVYATPYLYEGQQNPSQDIDLNNITFCDIPWFFADAYQGELSQEALRNSWQQIPTIYLRLIALGLDAYNLVAHLDKLDTIQYHGATGNLLLNHENRITRQLVCATFTDGIPVSTGFIKHLTEDYQSIATEAPANQRYNAE